MTKYKMCIKELPTFEQPREKMVIYGPESLSNSELMAIIIRTGTRTQSAIELSKTIINKYISQMADFMHLTHNELCQISGVGQAKACQILAAVELGRRITEEKTKKKIKITSPEKVAKVFMDSMRFLKKEHFKVVFLNTKNEIIGDKIIFIGSLNASIVHPRETFNAAIKMCSASIILLHNHPSGDPTPSKEDINITHRFYEAGKIIGIDVLDHIIIGNKKYYSLKENDHL